MVPTMTLWTFERQGEIAESCIPNISGAFMPAMILELQRFDPDFVVLPHTTVTVRSFIDMDGHMPFGGMMDANLVFVIGIPGNRRLKADRGSIEVNIAHMLRGVLHPREGIHVMLITE